jgi:hypothetical protein
MNTIIKKLLHLTVEERDALGFGGMLCPLVWPMFYCVGETIGKLLVLTINA